MLASAYRETKRRGRESGKRKYEVREEERSRREKRRWWRGKNEGERRTAEEVDKGRRLGRRLIGLFSAKLKGRKKIDRSTGLMVIELQKNHLSPASTGKNGRHITNQVAS
eukprot:146499-Hanusia_phi.AAC.1